MSRHIVISPSQNLIDQVVAQLPPGTNDFSRTAIVFPGKRPAHFVRKALARQIGHSIIPPRMFSIDTFVDELALTKLGLHELPLEDLDAVALLFDIHVNLPEKFGAGHFQTIDRFLSVGFKLYAELEELVMADTDVRRIQEVFSAEDPIRFKALPKYFDRFYGAVRHLQLSTRALRYRAVADSIRSIDLGEYDIIVLAGFYAYTALEQRIFTELVQRENVIVISQMGPGIVKHLTAIGIDLGAEALPSPDRSPVCHYYRSADTHGQVFAVSQKLKTMLDGGRSIDEKTVIVLPNAEALFPVVHHTLPLLPAEDYNISLGYPLQRTPLYGFFINLLSVVAGARDNTIPIAKYVAFILHPYTKNILHGQRSEISRVLFHALETFLAHGQSKMYITLEELEGLNVVFERVSQALAAGGTDVSIPDLKAHLRGIHDQTIRRFLYFDSLGDFATKSIDLLKYVYRHSTATRHPLFRPYAQRLVELLDSLSRSRLTHERLADIPAYVSFFRNAAAAESVPFPGTPLKGLQVIGLLETRNLSFDTVFVLNATDDVIPGTGGNDVLLPQRLRETLGLETYRDRERLLEYYFNTLLAGAQEVHCYFTESGNHEKSRFIEKLLWERQQEKRSLELDHLVRVIHYNVELATSRPDPIEKDAALMEHLRDFEFTATALDTYCVCPLRFYYGYVLRLAEKETVSEDVEQRDVGSFVHEILASYFRGIVGRPMTSGDLDLDHLRLTVDRVFAEHYGNNLIGPALLVKQQVTHQLAAFVTNYQTAVIKEQSVTLLGLEEHLSVISDGYHFAGRIDRIEQRGSRHVILDYKTGRDDKRVRIDLAKLSEDDSDSWRDAIGSFQLVVYMLLYSKAKHVSLASIDPAYLFLGRNEIKPEIEIGIGGGRESAEEVYGRVYPIMIEVVKEILDAQKPFTPPQRLERACPDCPYRSICGTMWVGG